MKIEKVNDHQIRCTLTREDLVSRELKISELAYGTSKAKDLFREMMQQAALEFDFDAEDIPLMIEAIPLNSECIVLIVTKVEDPEELDTRFAKFAPSVSENDEDDSADETSELTSISEEVMELFDKINKISPEKQEDSPATPVHATQEECQRVFAFPSMNELTGLARIFGPQLCCLNSLYKNAAQKQYLLVVKQGELSTGSFGKICNTISEYGYTLKMARSGKAYMDEHYTLILADNALQVLSEI